MTALSIWESIGGVLLAALLLGFIPRAIATRQGLHNKEEVPILSITGAGLWFHCYWPVSATWPLVRLDLCSWGIRMGPSWRLNVLLPTTELEWGEITSVTQTTFGLRFRRSDRRGWMRFSRLGGIDPLVVTQLYAHGVPFNN